MALREKLREWQEVRKAEWARGAFIANDSFATMASNIRAVAECDAIQAVLDVSLSDLMENSDE